MVVQNAVAECDGGADTKADEDAQSDEAEREGGLRRASERPNNGGEAHHVLCVDEGED